MVIRQGVWNGLAETARSTARCVSGVQASAAARSASELPGKTVDDRNADRHNAQMPPSPARKEVMDSTIEMSD